MITQERLKELLHYDPDTGIFTWRVGRGGMRVGDKAGGITTTATGKSYIVIGIDGKDYKAHRLSWLFIHGKFPSGQIDHENGNGLDNRLVNLRDVTPSENQKNARLRSNNTSGTCGVYWYKPYRKWKALIQVNSKSKHLGYFEDIQDAIATRKEAENEHGYHQNHGANRPL